MANYINFTKKTFNPYNPKVLNEGQFSWMTQDTDQQIGSERENTIEVWMYDNQGNSWYEKRYEGYGEFGGMDYYELLARMNGYSEEDLENYKGSFKEMRQLGIDLAFKKLKTKDKGKKVLFPALVADGRYNWKRHDFTQEAESDPNQSWYQEPEYDDYEDDYYESEKPELTWEGLKESLGLNESMWVMPDNYDKSVDLRKDLDKAFDRLEKVVGKEYEKFVDTVKKYTTGREAEYGKEAGFDKWQGKDAVKGAVAGMIIRVFNTNPRTGNYSADWMFEDLDINERSINKISKDHASTVLAMSTTVKEWKEAEGDRKEELMQKLRELNKQKADLEKELDDAVAGKDRNLQLSLEEAEDLAYLEIDVEKILEQKDEE